MRAALLGGSQLSRCFGVLLILLTFLGAAGPASAAPIYYPRQLNCSAFTPPACTATFRIGTDNELNYTAPYEESCGSTHHCVTPDVHATSYTVTAVSSSATQVAPWFCSAASIAYPARVSSNTGLPPGKLEDQMAACAFANLRVGLLLEDCRDVQLWTCDDCLHAYKAWLCSSLFPRCIGNNVDDGVVKPCLELCWAVSRRCPATQGLYCPINGEQGDYLDKSPPDCLHPAQQATQALLPPNEAPLAAQFSQPLPIPSLRLQSEQVSGGNR